MEYAVNWRARLAQEVLISAALGALPLVIAYHVGGTELTTKVLIAEVPERSVLWYLAALIVPYAAIVFWDWFFLKRTDRQRARMRFLRSTWKEIGMALHALWRVLAGAILAIPFLWFFVDPDPNLIGGVVQCLWVGGLILAECWIFSWAASYLEQR